jgi:hypothetical protein
MEMQLLPQWKTILLQLEGSSLECSKLDAHLVLACYCLCKSICRHHQPLLESSVLFWGFSTCVDNNLSAIPS